VSAVDRPRPPRAFWALGIAGVVCAALTIASGLFVREISTALPAVAVLCACGLMWQWQGGYRFLTRGRGPWSSVLPSLALVPLTLAIFQVAMMVWWFTVTDLDSVPDRLMVLAGILLWLPVLAAALTVASNMTFAVRLRDAGLLNLTTPAGSIVSNEL
jgi:hypothetical protein